MAAGRATVPRSSEKRAPSAALLLFVLLFCFLWSASAFWRCEPLAPSYIRSTREAAEPGWLANPCASHKSGGAADRQLAHERLTALSSLVLLLRGAVFFFLFFFSKTMPVFLFLKDVGYLFLRVKTCQV
jgi:hypothetical protein